MTTTHTLAPATVGLPLWDVIVSRKTLGPLPDDVDPGLVRVARADEVRAGDLVVGYYDDCPGRRWMPTAYVGELCYRALPAPHPLRREVLSLDGILFQWSAHELVLTVPAELAPVTYRAGERVERIAERRLENGPIHYRYAHHGTVLSADDGTVTVRFDADWLPTTLPASQVRHVEAEFVADDRATYGFAHGDTVTPAWWPATKGTVVDMWTGLDNVARAYVAWENEPPTDVPVRDLRAAAPLPAA
ncbi:hypothetical protein GTY75_09115 [Streptomyces sp. SID8381]|uniref:hypothetical protein n=1 Tax=unclassified Streptomyces TaxID=2593676 RepID=UPI00036C55B7|nr:MULTISPECIES: hypothetical protein [unclassified Streptomyces]MYX26826.1 hypothetical protein [Streptomyces sp. SID8381]